MQRCQEARSQFWEYLYDLIEGDELVELEAHLKGCPACAAELVRIEGLTDLLAAACKRSFPEVRFEPPPVVPIAGPAGKTASRSAAGRPRMPLLTPATGRTAWFRIAVAACLVVLVGGSVGGPSWLFFSGRAQLTEDVVRSADAAEQTARRTEGELARPFTENLRKVSELQESASRLENERRAAIADLERRESENAVVITAIGSNTFEAGGRNEIEIYTTRLNGTPANARLSARLVDRSNRVLCAEEQLMLDDSNRQQGQYKIAFPSDLALPPGHDIYLEIATHSAEGLEGQLRQWLHLSPPVYLTELCTDKSIYHLGETIYFRSLTLERATLKPADVDLNLVFTLLDPNGKVVLRLHGLAELEMPANKAAIRGPDGRPLRGIAAGAIPLPNPEIDRLASDGELKEINRSERTHRGFLAFAGKDLIEGEYTLQVSEANNLFPPEKQRIFIVDVTRPRKSSCTIEFDAPSYVPGAEVKARLRFRGQNKQDNAQPSSTTTFHLEWDGKKQPLEIDDSNNECQKKDNDAGWLRFRLPEDAGRGRGLATLVAHIGDEKSGEVVRRQIPMAISRLQIALYPEGGDLVAGFPNRVYFETFTPQGERVDFSGVLVDDTGDEVRGPDGAPIQVATAADEHRRPVLRGAGVFTFTPEAGRRYAIAALRPADIALEYRFPEVKREGLLLHVPKSVASEKDPIQVELHSIHAAPQLSVGPLWVPAKKQKIQRSLLVGAYCRGRLLAVRSIELLDGEKAVVSLKPQAGVGGVYRITVFEELPAAPSARRLVPLAERLIYRVPTEQLIITCETDRDGYSPGERVWARITTSDENEKAKPAIVTAAVIDKRALQGSGATRCTTATHFLLANEVRHPEDLEYADFLLTNHPQARRELDLLLGTQGWRRFAEQKSVEEFVQEHGDDARRLIAAIGRLPIHASNRRDVETACAIRVEQALPPIHAAYAAVLHPIQTELERLQSENRDLGTALIAAQRDLARLAELRARAESALTEFERQWLSFVMLAVGLSLLFVGGSSLVIGLCRREVSWPYFGTAAASLAVFVIGLVWLGGRADDSAGDAGHPHAVVGTESAVLESAFARLAEAPIVRNPLVRPEHPPAPGHAPNDSGPGRAATTGLDKSDAGGGGKAGAPIEALFDEGKTGKTNAIPEAGPDKAEVRRLRAVEQFRQQKELAELNERLLPGRKGKIGFGGKEGDNATSDQGAGASQLGKAPVPPRNQEFAAPSERAYLVPVPPAGPGGASPAHPPVAKDPKAENSGVLRRFYVREYCHKNRFRESGLRDYTATVYWHPALVLPDGSVDLSFELNDAETCYEVLLLGHTLDGRLGTGRAIIESRVKPPAKSATSPANPAPAPLPPTEK